MDPVTTGLVSSSYLSLIPLLSPKSSVALVLTFIFVIGQRRRAFQSDGPHFQGLRALPTYKPRECLARCYDVVRAVLFPHPHSLSLGLCRKQSSYSYLFDDANSAAGSETTAGVVTWWVQAMILYPEVQARAQAELDAVVGRDRIPTFADYEHMPYMRAMAKEVRCLPPCNTMLPRSSGPHEITC